MKKFVALLLVSFSLVGCGNNSDYTATDIVLDTESETENTSLQKLDKAEAEKIDAEIWEKNMSIINMDGHQGLISGTEVYLEGNFPKVELSNFCNSIGDSCATTIKEFPKSENEYIKAYVESSKFFCSQVQIEANLLNKYADSETTSDFLELQKQITITKKALVDLLNSRIEFLEKTGFTEEEIEAKFEKYIDDIDLAIYSSEELEAITLLE